MSDLDFTLYHYWRSSTSWRVRFAFELKSLPYTPIAVNLLNREHESKEHLKRHPLGAVPVLEVRKSGQCLFQLTQSLAIIQWLDETYPDRTPLMLGSALDRAKITELVETINADTHPLQNMHVQARFSDDPEKRKSWAHHWNHEGLSAFEALLDRNEFTGPWCLGSSITLADICLIPQVYNALRFEVDLSAFPKIQSIWKHAQSDFCFIASHPDQFQVG